MQLSNFRISVLLFCVMVSQLEPCLAAGTKSVKAWKLEQVHDIYGPYRVYASPVGIRAENCKNGIVVISRPPDWKVVAFSPVAKKYSVTKPENFHGSFCIALTMTTGRDMSQMPVSLTGSATVCGVKTKTYKTVKSFEESQAREFARHDINPGSVKRASYQVAESLHVPVQEGQLIARLFGLPRQNGVPLELKYDRVNAGEISFLSTKSCELKSVPVSLFSLPTGFTQAVSMESLLAESASGKGGIDLILHEMDKKEGFPMDARRW